MLLAACDQIARQDQRCANITTGNRFFRLINREIVLLDADHLSDFDGFHK
ncbi:Uncharacterised protein [Vibrio cholerae]|nr:Uncharacterised protein [Vibrio cholerae]